MYYFSCYFYFNYLFWLFLFLILHISHNYYIYIYFFMFRDVPECSMFQILRRPQQISPGNANDGLVTNAYWGMINY